VWGAAVIAGSGLFSACTSQVVDPRYTGTALTTQTAVGSCSPSIAVGTALADGPPHRSQRAGLPHWAPASGSGVEAHAGEGMPGTGRW
jgi:hypothetical protein